MNRFLKRSGVALAVTAAVASTAALGHAAPPMANPFVPPGGGGQSLNRPGPFSPITRAQPAGPNAPPGTQPGSQQGNVPGSPAGTIPRQTSAATPGGQTPPAPGGP